MANANFEEISDRLAAVIFEITGSHLRKYLTTNSLQVTTMAAMTVPIYGGMWVESSENFMCKLSNVNDYTVLIIITSFQTIFLISNVQQSAVHLKPIVIPPITKSFGPEGLFSNTLE